MAWSFVASTQFDQSATTSTAFVVTMPTHAAGDVCIISAYKDQDTGDWSTASTGWVLLSSNRASSGRDRSTAIFYKVVGASEADPTIDYSSANSEEVSWTAQVFRTSTGTISTSNVIGDFSYGSDQNIQNPTPTSITTSKSGQCLAIFQMQTHDDCTAAGAPIGFTLSETIIGGTKDNRQQLTAYDLDAGAAGLKTFTAWTSTWNASVSEYSIYTVTLTLDPVIGIDSIDVEMDWGDLNKVADGFGFEAVQGTGKVEFWSDVLGTIKVTQTIDSWSDTSIQFDTVQGGLSDNTANYIVATNDSGDESIPLPITFGVPAYSFMLLGLNPDHYWQLDNDYLDTGVGGATRDMTSGVVGTHPWVGAITEESSVSMHFDDVLDRREIVDSPFMNVTITSSERTICGWIQLGGIQKTLGAIWKEGGGVQNLALLIGIGNTLMAQMADSPGNIGNVQAVGGTRLAANRPYHILMRYSLDETIREMRLFIDGEEQSLELTDGNPMGVGVFNTHGGDVVWGDPDNNLETGGTDIAYAGQEDCRYAHWASWSDNSISTGALDKTTEIRDILFRRGALPKYTIAEGTEIAMQASLDSQLENSTVEDWPIGIRVSPPTSGSDLELVAKGIDFSSRTTIDLEWRGTGTLTWVNNIGSSIDATKLYATKNGTISIVDVVPIDIEVLDIDTNAPIENARVYILAGAGGDLAESTVLLNMTTDISGKAEGTIRYTNDQPITGRVRLATGSVFYKTKVIVGTIEDTGFVSTQLMIKD